MASASGVDLVADLGMVLVYMRMFEADIAVDY